MMKTKKKVYTVPCTVVCKMQMEGVIASSLPLSRDKDVVHYATTQGDSYTSLVGGDDVTSGGDDEDLEAAKKHNLFYDEE